MYKEMVIFEIKPKIMCTHLDYVDVPLAKTRPNDYVLFYYASKLRFLGI